MDGMGYTVGTGVATAQKIVQRPTTFLPRLPPFGLAGLFQRTIFPTVTCVQSSSHRPERPYYITIFRFCKGSCSTTEGGSCSKPQKEEVARNHRRMNLLETEGGSRSKTQKGEVARVHRRRKLLETTEGSCSKQKEEIARNRRRWKLLESTEVGRCSSPQKEEDARVHNRAVVVESCRKGPERQHKL